jgi:hypothetical protein
VFSWVANSIEGTIRYSLWYNQAAEQHNKRLTTMAFTLEIYYEND